MITTSVLPIWLFPINYPLKEISSYEEKIAKSLPPKRSHEYKFSRGYVRFALSQYLEIDPLEIPLEASPGKAPKLAKGLGYVSFSHSKDALIIGWSKSQLGIDIERSDRVISSRTIAKRFFNLKDLKYIQTLKEQQFIAEVLNQWVIKESLIKWQRGSIAKDLNKWNLNRQENIATHNTLNLSVNFCQISYANWVIAISTNENLDERNIIICLS